MQTRDGGERLVGAINKYNWLGYYAFMLDGLHVCSWVTRRALPELFMIVAPIH